MIKYDEYNVTVLEQVKERISESEKLKGTIRKKDIYLVDIPEESVDNDILVKLSYVELTAGNHSSNTSKSDVIGIQVDIWKAQPMFPIGEGNAVRDVMKDLGFYQVGSFDGYGQKELGKMRDSRRYVRSFKK